MQVSGSEIKNCEQAAAFFKALGDPARLRIAILLLQSPQCVSDIAAVLEDSLPAISQRLKLLHRERIVTRHRQGKQIFYSLADDHIAELVSNALAHADETDHSSPASSSPHKPTTFATVKD